jgi:hypothetical protein
MNASTATWRDERSSVNRKQAKLCIRPVKPSLKPITREKVKKGELIVAVPLGRGAMRNDQVFAICRSP